LSGRPMAASSSDARPTGAASDPPAPLDEQLLVPSPPRVARPPPALPPPVQAGRSFRQPASPRRGNLPQPSPRRLAPLASPQDEARGEVNRLHFSQTGEADVAAGERNICEASPVAKASAPAMELEEYRAAGRPHSLSTELRQLQPVLASPEVSAGPNSARSKWQRKKTQEVLAEALSPDKHSKSVSVKVVANVAVLARRASRLRKKHDDELSTTGQFWRAYQETPGHKGPAWQDPTPQKATATREELENMHGKSRHKLLRLIKTGQLPAAALVATGGSPAQGQIVEVGRDVKVSQEKAHLEVMGGQRRGLAEARKTLEKLVAPPTVVADVDVGKQLGFMLRGFGKPDPPPEAATVDDGAFPTLVPDKFAAHQLH